MDGLGRPAPPCARLEYRGFGSYFGPEDEFAAWLAEPWWRRLLGLTQHDRRAKQRRHVVLREGPNRSMVKEVWRNGPPPCPRPPPDRIEVTTLSSVDREFVSCDGLLHARSERYVRPAGHDPAPVLRQAMVGCVLLAALGLALAGLAWAVVTGQGW